jgi:hypothetical protein
MRRLATGVAGFLLISLSYGCAQNGHLMAVYGYDDSGSNSVRCTTPAVAAKPQPEARVLNRDQLAPFIAACKREHDRICKEFDTIDIDFDSMSVDAEDPYRPSCQAFSFADGRTFFAFSTLGETGAVVFDTSSRKILEILPWSKMIERERGDEVDPSFDKTFYALSQDQTGQWTVMGLVFAIYGDRQHPRFETWEFYYGPGHCGFSSRYVMQPVREADSGN